MGYCPSGSFAHVLFQKEYWSGQLIPISSSASIPDSPFPLLHVLTHTHTHTHTHMKREWGVLVFKASITNCHQLGSLKQWIFIVSRFWSLYIWYQVVDTTVFPLKSVEKSSLASFSVLVAGQQSLVFLGLQVHDTNLCLCHQTAFSPCVSFSIWLSSYKDTSYWIRGPPTPVWPHLNLITSAMILFPNKFILLSTWG